MKASIKILVVDESASMRKNTKSLLNKLGFTNVHVASEGSAAWEQIEKSTAEGGPFEFIISDWSMSKMSGLDLLKKVRAADGEKKVPFLLITGEAEQGTVVTAVQAGVSNFIVKPFSAVTLKEKIEKIFFKK